ncbi:hypothetical protein EMCRGX_G025608 [Ephydatia muelleri]
MLPSPLLHQEPRYSCYQAHYYTKNLGTHAIKPTTTLRTQLPMLSSPLLHQEPRYPYYQAHYYTKNPGKCCSAPLTREGQFNMVRPIFEPSHLGDTQAILIISSPLEATTPFHSMDIVWCSNLKALL